jgi:PTS system nitrogen regulatory IIA component
VDRSWDMLDQVAASLGFVTAELRDVSAASPESAIRFLMEQLVASGRLRAGDAEEAVHAVLRRERLACTAVGGGVAIPHTITSSVERVEGIVARSPSGVRWGAPDGLRVRCICLVLSPRDDPGGCLRAYEQLSRALKPDGK